MTKRMHTKLSVQDSFFKSYLVLNYSKSAHLVRKSSWGGAGFRRLVRSHPITRRDDAPFQGEDVGHYKRRSR